MTTETLETNVQETQEQRKARVLADESLMQRAGGRLVERGVLHRLNQLMYDIMKNTEQATAVFGLDYDELISWAVINDYESAARDAGWDEDDSGNIFLKAGKLVDFPAHRHGDAGDFDYYDVIMHAGGVAAVNERFNLGVNFDEVDDDDEAVWEAMVEEQLDELIGEYREGNKEEADDWSEACDCAGVKPYECEVYEYWAVDSWFAARLREQGELVFEFCDFTVWGRTTTGQSIYLDGVIRRIVSDMPEYAYVFDDL